MIINMLESIQKLRVNPNQQLTNEQKEAIIFQALQSEEGRIALAKAMIEPIRCGGLEYSRLKAEAWKNGILISHDFDPQATPKQADAVRERFKNLMNEGTIDSYRIEFLRTTPGTPIIMEFFDSDGTQEDAKKAQEHLQSLKDKGIIEDFGVEYQEDN